MNAEYYLYTNLKRILLTSRIKLEVVSDKPQGHVKMAQCIWGESLGGIMDYTAVRVQTNTTSTNDKFEKDNEGSEDSADTECGPQRQN